MEKVRLLYVEDDRDIAFVNKRFLEFKGFDVIEACDGNEAWDLYNKEKPDLVLLDIMMPGRNGFEVLRLIRSVDTETPVLMLSSLTSSKDVVAAIEAGANDFIRKEFLLEEVDVRLRSAYKINKQRANRAEGICSSQEVRLSAISTFCFLNKTVTINEKTIKLTATEAKLLRALCENKGKFAAKEELCELIWGTFDDEKNRYLSKYVTQLRKQLADDKTISIENSYGEGFCIVKR